MYTPATSRNLTDLPVLLWYYGGAFVLGDGWSGGMYDGTYIVGSKDVIIVTTNYRLGSFGFLVTEASNGNYAVEDQRLALYWVRDNIAAFGGDPNKVTTTYPSSSSARLIALQGHDLRRVGWCNVGWRPHGVGSQQGTLPAGPDAEQSLWSPLQDP